MMEELLAGVSSGIESLLGPMLRAIFHPIDNLLASFFMPWARIVTLAFFIGTMVWVFVGLKREYVNVEAPSRRAYHDLRFWVIVSMLPHVIVYLCF